MKTLSPNFILPFITHINKYKEKRAKKKNARNERLFWVKKMNRFDISGYIGWPFIRIINETNLNFF